MVIAIPALLIGSRGADGVLGTKKLRYGCIVPARWDTGRGDAGLA